MNIFPEKPRFHPTRLHLTYCEQKWRAFFPDRDGGDVYSDVSAEDAVRLLSYMYCNIEDRPYVEASVDHVLGMCDNIMKNPATPSFIQEDIRSLHLEIDELKITKSLQRFSPTHRFWWFINGPLRDMEEATTQAQFRNYHTSIFSDEIQYLERLFLSKRRTVKQKGSEMNPCAVIPLPEHGNLIFYR